MLENGHLSEEQIALYADAVIANQVDKVDSALRNHILECDKCAEKVMAVTEISEDYLISRNLKLAKIMAFTKRYWFQIAASIILILGSGLIIYQLNQVNNIPLQGITEIEEDSTEIILDTTMHLKPKKTPIAQEKTSTTNKFKEQKKKQQEDKILLAYAEDANMEKLVDRYNNATLRGNLSIDMQSTIKIKPNDELVFEWDNANDELLIVEFFNNSGEKLFEEETSDSLFKTKRIKNPGLYYWKLLNEDFDLLFCGKIIVQ